MEYITTKEASAKWNISTTRITILANEGRIPGAQRFGRSWLIPSNATKPQELKPNHSGSAKKNTKKNNNFSFPLYHFRPDWSYIKEAQLSNQQQTLLQAETAVLECRFADAYPSLESILQAPDDIAIEIGCLWNIGICCIALNKPDDFSKYYLRFQMLLSEDFPHRDDFVIILDALSTYIDTVNSVAKNNNFNTEVNDQCLPLACTLIGYKHLSQEIINPGSTDTTLMELHLRFLTNTSAVITVEMMHCYLLGIYNLRQNTAAMEKHAKEVVQIAFENKFYFPLITFFHFFAPILPPILDLYPEEFQRHIYALSLEYDKNCTAFLSTISGYSIISKITSEDQTLIYAVLMDFSNTVIADKLKISPRTVARRLDMICKKLGVNSKKELKDFLRHKM